MNYKVKAFTAGFTLIEILIAICILALVVTPFLTLFMQTANTNHAAMENVSKSTMIQYEIEKLRRGSYNECFGYNSMGRQPLENYFVSTSAFPYPVDSTASIQFDFVLKETVDNVIQAYVVAPDGATCSISCSPNKDRFSKFNFSRQDNHFILRLQTMEGTSVIDDQQVGYQEVSGSVKPVVINLYISDKPETLPFLVNLEECAALSNITIKLWDNAFYQNEGKVSYKDPSRQQHEIVIAPKLSEGADVPPFTTMLDQSDTEHASMVKFTVRVYGSLEAEIPIAERISIVPIIH